MGILDIVKRSFRLIAHECNPLYTVRPLTGAVGLSIEFSNSRINSAEVNPNLVTEKFRGTLVLFRRIAGT
jgi:hypothetical protein